MVGRTSTANSNAITMKSNVLFLQATIMMTSDWFGRKTSTRREVCKMDYFYCKIDQDLEKKKKRSNETHEYESNETAERVQRWNRKWQMKVQQKQKMHNIKRGNGFNGFQNFAKQIKRLEILKKFSFTPTEKTNSHPAAVGLEPTTFVFLGRTPLSLQPLDDAETNLARVNRYSFFFLSNSWRHWQSQKGC